MHAVIRLTPFVLHLAAPVCLGAATAYLTGNNETFYSSLALPRYAPPGWLFGVVWAVLYLLMGLASYLVHTDRRLPRSDRNSALTLYGFALLVNLLWSFLFFKFRLFLLAACWCVIILAVTGLCTALFYRLRRPAGLLLVPAMAWLVFTGALNFSIAFLN